ncbi:hypothetical protein [Pseudomonas shirazensis]
MKKLKSIALVALFMSTSLFVSCSNDSDNPNEETPEASSGDYWPTAVGNKWVLDQNGSAVNMNIIGSEKINGDTYFKFDQLAGTSQQAAGTATAWIKKVEGDYYIKLGDIVYNAEGITGKITGYEFILFKDYLEVNKTWTGSYSQETSFNIPNFPTLKVVVNYTGTILERGATATVKNVTYKDVIKFKLRLDAKTEGQTSSSEVEYWISKNVGVIKMKTGDSVSELVSYSLK